MRNPFAPLIAIPRPGIPCTIAGSGIGLKFRRLPRRCPNHRVSAAIRVTHLAKKALPMRHPLAPQHRIPLKKRSLQRHE
jgi:hypothetical protein